VIEMISENDMRIFRALVRKFGPVKMKAAVIEAGRRLR
jgi:hypothetical protein